MCAHADYREGFRVCALEARRLIARFRRRLESLLADHAPGNAPVEGRLAMQPARVPPDAAARRMKQATRRGR